MGKRTPNKRDFRFLTLPTERLLRAAVSVLGSGMQSTFFALARPALGGFLDTIEVDPDGLIRIVGWSTARFEPGMAPRVLLDDETIPFLQHYWLPRPDVTKLGSTILAHPGLVLEYLVPESLAFRRFDSISVVLGKAVNCRFEGEFEFLNPHYRELFGTEQVYHRENIYGSGPPNAATNPEAFSLARDLPDPILDFGCGSGALVEQLRALGLETQGLELDTELLRRSVRPSVSSAITLYDGNFPSPFPDRSFKSVFCSEVLEHIPNYESAIRDIARLATERAIFTVPDASGIPAGFRHWVVPWHLLEGTHVNFFTQKSLCRALKPHFSRVEFGRVGARTINDGRFYVSLVAACSYR